MTRSLERRVLYATQCSARYLTYESSTWSFVHKEINIGRRVQPALDRIKGVTRLGALREVHR